jgi:hypothetical protein
MKRVSGAIAISLIAALMAMPGSGIAAYESYTDSVIQRVAAERGSQINRFDEKGRSHESGRYTAVQLKNGSKSRSVNPSKEDVEQRMYYNSRDGRSNSPNMGMYLLRKQRYNKYNKLRDSALEKIKGEKKLDLNFHTPTRLHILGDGTELPSLSANPGLVMKLKFRKRK